MKRKNRIKIKNFINELIFWTFFLTLYDYIFYNFGPNEYIEMKDHLTFASIKNFVCSDFTKSSVTVGLYYFIF